MQTQAQILDFLKKNKPFFQQELGVSTLGLFGSYAQNEQNEASDVDVLFEFEENTTDLFIKKFNFHTFLEQNLSLSVDLVRIKYLSNFSRERILNQVIYV
jgi:uncharacterized protein